MAIVVNGLHSEVYGQFASTKNSPPENLPTLKVKSPPVAILPRYHADNAERFHEIESACAD